MSATETRFSNISVRRGTATTKNSAMDVWGSDQDSELSNPPTDLDSDDGKPKTTKRKGRATNFRLKQGGADTYIEDEDGDEGQSDADEESGDEWKPVSGGISYKASKSTRKHTKKNVSKVKKATNTEPLACPWPGCDRRLARKDHLRRHVAAHTRGKPFRCPAAFCSYAAKRRDNLAEHLKLRHKLSAAAARKSAAGAARAASAEIRSLAAAVEATINAAASAGDDDTAQDAVAGRKRKNKDSHDAATRGKKQARVSNSIGGTDSGAGELSAVDQEDEDHITAAKSSKKHGRILRSTVAREAAAVDEEAQSDETQNGTMNRGEDLIDDSDPGDDGPGVPFLKAAQDAWGSDIDEDNPSDLTSEEEGEA